MTSKRTTGTQPPPTGSPAEIRADIEQTRAELGDSVEALAAKADVKARTKETVAAAKDRAKDTAQDVGAKVRRRPLPVVAMLVSVAAATVTGLVIRRRRAAKAARTRGRLPWRR